jgi:hypothetical protein
MAVANFKLAIVARNPRMREPYLAWNSTGVLIDEE